MNELLLVLLLLSDPSAQPAATAVMTRVQDSAETARTPLRVLVGPEALAHLKAAGVGDADLTSGPAVGDAYTRTNPRTAIIRLERRLSAGSVVLESRVWVAGQAESHVAIGDGVKADPVESSARGVGLILEPWLATHTGDRPVDDGTSDLALARLADTRQWTRIVETPAGTSARSGYYRVLALVRLQRHPEAAEALATLQAAHPHHVMTRAAEGLLAPGAGVGEVDINNAATEDDGGNTLR
jgi:hypothetical protein